MPPVRQPSQLLRTLLVALAAVVVSLRSPLRAAAIPFSEATPPTLSFVNSVCYVDATSRGITSVAVGDLDAYAGLNCATASGPQGVSGILLGNNSLSWLPTDLFTAMMVRSNLQLISLAANRFNSTNASIGNLFSTAPSGTLSACVFCPLMSLATIDLSFNQLGPSVSPALQFASSRDAGGVIRQVSLILAGCNLTDIQPNAFSNALLTSLDLSLNDLSSGLHVGSFNRLVWPTFLLFLRNCRLRSSSLVPGLFVKVAKLYMGNLARPLAVGSQSGNVVNFDFDPLQRAFTKERFTPPGQTWRFNPPTLAQLDASWGNLFVAFPSGVLSSPALLPWNRIELGDVVSFAPDFLRNVSLLKLSAGEGSVLAITMAPSSVAATMLSVGQQYCPLHSVVNAINWALQNDTVVVQSLVISGYDLPTTAECGAYPSCSGCRPLFASSGSSRTLTVEPAFMEPAFAQWLSPLAQLSALTFVPPVLDMWNPQLNRSDWIDLNYFCAIGADTIVLPALPFNLVADPSSPSFPFTPPAGVLTCLRTVPTLFKLDWSLARQFSAAMLVGANLITQRAILWTFDLDALYGTASPVPLAFFDTLPAGSVIAGADCVPGPPLCTRIRSHCPYIVNGVCEPWSDQRSATATRDTRPVTVAHLCRSCRCSLFACAVLRATGRMHEQHSAIALLVPQDRFATPRSAHSSCRSHGRAQAHTGREIQLR